MNVWPTPALSIVAAGDLGPAGAWRAWSFDPLVVAGLAGAAWIYGTGVRRLWSNGRGGRAGGHRGRGVSPWQVWAFVAGLLAVAVALISPLDALSESLLSAHMVQHVLLLVIAPVLITMGRPLIATAAALPGARRSARWLARTSPGRSVARLLGHPLVVWLLALMAMWTWHVPALYDAAVESALVHALEHASFLATALLFWATALQSYGPRRLARGLDVVFVVTGAVPGAVLGALLVFASSPLYRVYAGSAEAWGVSPLADQQWAGAVMWIPAGIVHLVVASALFVRWLRAMDREAEREDRRSSRFAVRDPGGPSVSRDRSHAP